MADGRFGVHAKLRLKRSPSDSWTDTTGVASGTGNITATRTRDTRPVPGGRGIVASRLGQFTVHDFAAAFRADSTHDPLFRDGHGQRFYYQWRPVSDSTGDPSYEGEAVATVTKTFDMTRGGIVYAVQFAGDGEPTESTIS